MAQLAAMRCSQVPNPIGLESPQLRVRPEERLLDHVLGVLLVAGDAVRHAEDGTAVPLDERPKRLAIAGPGLGQDEGRRRPLVDLRREGRPAALGDRDGPARAAGER